MTDSPRDEEWDATFRGMCAGCGYLGKRGKSPPYSVESAVTNERLDGALWELADKTPAQPFCAKHVDLLGEVAAALINDPDQEPISTEDAARARNRKTRATIDRRDRKCPLWTRWDVLAGPLDHLERERLGDMEAQRRRWQADLEENRKAWEKKLADERLSWEIKLQDEATSWQKSVRRESRLWQLLILVVTVVGIVAAVQFG